MIDVHVWWAHPHLASARPDPRKLLDDRERERHARFHFQSDRDRYVVAHALARLVVAQATGCAAEEIEFSLYCRTCAARPEASAHEDSHGKPYPVGAASGVEISLSHSQERVVVAVSHGVPVGVDVEAISVERDLAGLAEHALTGTEQRELRALPSEERASGFFTYWSRKEALLKASGDGLAGGLTTISVSGPTESPALLAWEHSQAPDYAHLTDLDPGIHYRAALAVLTPEPVTVANHDAIPLLNNRDER